MLKRLLNKVGFLSGHYFFLSENKFFNLRKLQAQEIKLNFLVIGSMKSGTSSLFDYLGMHEDVFTTSIKEPGFFLPKNEEKYKPYYNSANYIRRNMSDRDLYKMLFDSYKGERLRGEASTHYTKVPQFDFDLPTKIYAYNSEIKLIYLVRNPYQRMISQFLHARKAGFTSKSISDVLKEDDLYLNISLYHKQLKPYFDVFPANQILVVKFEEFVRNPQREFERVLTFLGLDTERIESINFKPSNVSKNRSQLKDDGEIDDGEIQKEIQLLLNDTLAFGALTGLDVSDWLVDLKQKIS